MPTTTINIPRPDFASQVNPALKTALSYISNTVNDALSYSTKVSGICESVEPLFDPSAPYAYNVVITNDANNSRSNVVYWGRIPKSEISNLQGNELSFIQRNQYKLFKPNEVYQKLSSDNFENATSLPASDHKVKLKSVKNYLKHR